MKVTLNGISINYVERGLPQGLPVIFLHGFPFNHTMWNPQAGALPNSVRFIAPDLRGHGESDVDDGLYTIEFFADDVLLLLDHLNIRQAVVCGLSMGGYIALECMKRRPELFIGLILADTRSESDANEAKRKRAATIRQIKSEGVQVFAEEFLKILLAPKSIASNPELVKHVKKMIVDNDPHAICATLLALASRVDATPSLGAITAPTLILCGAEDALTPPALSQAMHEKITGSELKIVPEAGHISTMENAPYVNSCIISFLAKLKK
jgi:pimeloyl-ACP methyl ester carboxylesterase